MAKLVALYTVVVNVLANAGLMVSDETAKQIRQVCTWANVKFTFPKLEDAVMDFYMLSLKYYRLLHERGTYVSDDWLARNMVKAFRQNRDENKFGGVIHLLKDYIQKETNAFLKGELDSVDFILEPEDQFIGAINSWICDGFLTVNGEALRSRLVKLFNLDANVIIMHVSKDGTAESFRLVSTFGQKDPQIDVEAEENLADECQVVDSSAPVLTSVPVNKQAEAVLPKNVAEPVKTVAVNPALKRLAAAAMTAPLAQPKAEEVKATGNTVAPITADVTKAAETIGTSLEEFQKKYAAAENIPRFAIRLAQTEEVRARRRACKTKEDYKGIDPLSDISIIEMLMSPDAKYNWLRAAALGKSAFKSSAPDLREKYEKSDFFLCVCDGKYELVHRIPAKDEIVGDNKYYSLRLWILKDATEPEGMIYTGDQAQNPFLRFKWGFARNGLSFPLPKVERKIPGTREYAPLPEEMKGVAEAIRKALVEKNCIPKRKPRPSDLGITLQSNWGTRVVNQ